MNISSLAVRFDRVSSEDQRDGFSLDAQKDLGEKYAREHGFRYMKTWAVDESASKEDERKHFFAMIAFVKENKIKDVVFDKVDRACRGLKSAVQIEELIDHFGVRFHFTREHLIIDKGSPPQEKLRFYLGTILAKYYVDNLRTEVNKGMEARLQAGFWNHRAPLGYKNIRTGKEKRAIVIPDGETAPVVREMFQLYATGNYPWAYFVKYLRQKLNKPISKCLVDELLKNPFYYGEMKVHGNRLLKGAHEPLISKELWDSCQKIRGIRAAVHRSVRAGIIPKPLMGWMKCGLCGHSITGEAKRKPSGKTYVYYHCAKHECPQHSINTEQNILFKQIEAAFEPFKQFSPDFTNVVVKTLESKLSELDLYTQGVTSGLAVKRKEVKDTIAKLELLQENGVLSNSEYQEVMRVKKLTLEKIKTEIDKHNEADIQTFNEGIRIIELFRKVHSFMTLGNNELEKMRVAKLVLSNPLLSEGTLRFDYQKPFDVLLLLTSGEVWCGRQESNLRPSDS